MQPNSTSSFPAATIVWGSRNLRHGHINALRGKRRSREATETVIVETLRHYLSQQCRPWPSSYTPDYGVSRSQKLSYQFVVLTPHKEPCSNPWPVFGTRRPVLKQRAPSSSNAAGSHFGLQSFFFQPPQGLAILCQGARWGYTKSGTSCKQHKRHKRERSYHNTGPCCKRTISSW